MAGRIELDTGIAKFYHSKFAIFAGRWAGFNPDLYGVGYYR